MSLKTKPLKRMFSLCELTFKASQLSQVIIVVKKKLYELALTELRPLLLLFVSLSLKVNTIILVKITHIMM